MTDKSRNGSGARRLLTNVTTISCAVFAAFWATYPFARSLFRLQVGYNEGWNVYSAERVTNNLKLYPVAYGWQTVNYPMLSFYLVAFLHRFTHDYLFTARILSLLSLIACCALCGCVVRQLCGSRRSAILSAFFCLGAFCTNADLYVGMDDPQLLAQAFFLSGFAVYLYNRRGLSALSLAAALFVLAGSIKHNPIDFPLAVLCDLALLSWRRALWFLTCGSACTALSVALNIHFGGPYFLTQMLAARAYDFRHGFQAVTLGVLPPLIGPLALTIAFAWTLRVDPTRRVVTFLLALSLLVGTFFAGGAGVSTNTYFSTMIAVSLLIGLFLSDWEKGSWTWTNHLLALYSPWLIFFWLLVPAGCNGVINPVKMLRLTAERQRRFDEDIAFLKRQPSPQICEDLLLCFYAGQPYLYDPFNATRLMQFGKLNPQVFVGELNQRVFGAIELEQHSPEDLSQQDRFPKSFLQAIREQYDPVVANPEVVFYVPKEK